MSTHLVTTPQKVTVPQIQNKKSVGQKITCLTAYDYPTARLLDEAGVDMILVGDSLGMTMLGYSSTLPVTLEEVLVHLRAVRRGVERALLIGDMPYGSFHIHEEETLRNAIRLVKEGGAEAVKLEGGARRASMIRRLIEAEIPVMGHLGLTPQSVNAFGGYRVQGKTDAAARTLLDDARLLEELGVFSIVLEGVPRQLARTITEALRIPTIGIGAGPDCDGQVLVTHDLLGLHFSNPPKFVRPYANLKQTILDAVRHYCADIREQKFPSDAESYH